MSPMASPTATLRKTLSAVGLVRILRCRFSAIADSRRAGSVTYSLSDTLMAAFAMFQFKSPSLLAFDKAARLGEQRTLIGNLSRLYRLAAVPSDTQMRSILDEVSPASLRAGFRAVHTAVQRGRMLEDFKVLGDRLLVSIDGTGLFSSTALSCPQCGVKRRSDGTVEYYHQLLAAVIVAPHHKSVLPIDFELIVKSDGQSKDCCERNASARLIPSIAAQYPKRRFIVVEDALGANGPHVKLLRAHRMDFVIGAKPLALKHLFAAFDARRAEELDGAVVEFEETDEKGVRRGARFANDLPLNASHEDERVNLMEFWEVSAKGKVTNWGWITSLAITRENALQIASFARSRWRIENATFNTLKNQGYHFEHNYGHGERYLSSTLAGLMLLAFLCDQVQEHACGLFQAARAEARTKTSLWARMLTYLQDVEIPDWKTLWGLIGKTGPRLTISYAPDTG